MDPYARLATSLWFLSIDRTEILAVVAEALVEAETRQMLDDRP